MRVLLEKELKVQDVELSLLFLILCESFLVLSLKKNQYHYKKDCLAYLLILRFIQLQNYYFYMKKD